MLSRIFKRQTFNDTLALILLPGIPGLWVLSHWYPLPEAGLGASIAVWTLVAQFYFRRTPSNGGTA